MWESEEASIVQEIEGKSGGLPLNSRVSTQSLECPRSLSLLWKAVLKQQPCHSGTRPVHLIVKYSLHAEDPSRILTRKLRFSDAAADLPAIPQVKVKLHSCHHLSASKTEQNRNGLSFSIMPLRLSVHHKQPGTLWE